MNTAMEREVVTYYDFDVLADFLHEAIRDATGECPDTRGDTSLCHDLAVRLVEAGHFKPKRVAPDG